MKRLKTLLATMLLACWPAFATTYYVDATCPTAGDGTSATCSGTDATHNPKKDIVDAVGLVTAAGDKMVVRGIHAAHDNYCPGDTEGRYYGDKYTIVYTPTSQAGVFEPYNYAVAGETVYLDGATYPTGGWTQCTWNSGTSTCNCGTGYTSLTDVGNGGQTACEETWRADGTGTYSNAINAEKPDGTPTYKIKQSEGRAGLTNAHSGYTGTFPEQDSYSTEAGKIFVRWGTGDNAPGNSVGHRNLVFNNQNGNGFYVGSGVSNVTIHGFTFRSHLKASFVVENATGSTITFQDNKVLYTADKESNGSGYGVAIYNSTGVHIYTNEIGWSDSEGIHQQAKTSGATAQEIKGNWIHDQGQKNFLGTGAIGTPAGMILGDDGSGHADLTGTVVDSNYIAYTIGIGIVLENTADNAKVTNNFIYRAGGDCYKLDGVAHHADGNTFFNNLAVECGYGGNEGAGISLFSNGSNNLFWNNTLVNSSNGCFRYTGSGTATGTVFSNNNCYDSGDKLMVDFSKGGTFNNNNAYSATRGSSSNVVSWGGTGYTCSGVTSLDSASKCANPNFKTSTDYHIASTSICKNAGRSTGMPSGRTTDIYNYVAGSHGQPSYTDGQGMFGSAWDIGADEYSTNGGGGGSGCPPACQQ